ncbi:MAG: glutamate--tRNA ligase [Myxococcales bacterium]|nr:glutamate--tRNA ligase [Myxococcales bacterium]
MSATSDSATNTPPRVRIAPSPTGDPHVGTAYIALFNYVFARKSGGTFLLRIEDTDQERYTPGSEAAIFEALRWLGLTWDEGPDVGGPHGPYRQSERLALYREQADVLRATGKAYRCFCTKERLDGVRQQQIADKRDVIGYDGHCRALPPEESDRRAAAGEPFVLRLRVPKDGGEVTTFVDNLRPEPISFENRLVDDQVLMKSDGFPTYHLANVVDDHFMGITHVIRGEEWITSTPKHVLLYQAFGWTAPKWYHLGLLRNADRSKLSKRKNPVSIFHYRELGYLPSTLLNFMANLGFSFGDDRERFTVDEMIEHFEWSKVSVGGPVFDTAKLDAFNGSDVRGLSVDELYERLMDRVLTPQRLKALLAQAQERVNLLDDFIPYLTFFFGSHLDYAPVKDKLKPLAGRTGPETATLLDAYTQEIEKDTEARSFTPAALDAFTRAYCDKNGLKNKEFFMLLRLAVSGRTASPSLFDTMALCGKDRCRLRIRDVCALLKAGK